MFNALIKSRAARDVLVLAGGRFGAALVGLVTAPFIARLFEPSDFGVVAFFVVIATLASQLLPLSYPNAISIPKADGDAKAIVRIALYASIGLACVLYLVLFTLYIMGWVSPVAAQLGLWEWLVPVAALMLAVSLICEGWLTRTRGFAASARAAFSQALVTAGGRLGLGLMWGSSVWGLVVPYIAGAALQLGILARASWSTRKPDTPPSEISVVARGYSEFPKYNLPAGFLRALSENLPVIFFAPVFGVAAAGLYAMADRLIKMPLTLGAQSVRRVYLQRASVIVHRDGDLKSSYVRVTGWLMLLGLPPTLLLMMAGESMLRLLLGERWAQAGAFVEILSPLFYVMLVSRPATALVDLLRKQRLWLRIQMASSLFRAIAMVLAWQLWGTQISVLWGFVVAGMFPYMWCMLHIYSSVDVQEGSRDLPN